METLIYVDTHAVVWLYSGQIELFPPEAVHALEEDELLISPLVLLEIEYLRETGKIREHPQRIMEELSKTIGLAVCDLSFEEVAMEALRLNWTRDPFDRIITAHASLKNALLLTKDSTIHRHYKKAIWD